jgi:hypothetical protein
VGRVTARVAWLAGAVFLALPAGALADVRFQGETSQSRSVTVVAEDNGVPKRARIAWRADCRRPGFRVIETTTFRTPLELSTRRRFRDNGSYRLRARGGYRLTLTPTISGRKVAPRRWAGRFRATVVVRRAGRVRDRCSVRGITWRVRRVRPARVRDGVVNDGVVTQRAAAGAAALRAPASRRP